MIKVLRQENGYGAKKFIKKFLNRNWSPSSSNKLLTKLDQSVNVDCKPSSGKKRKTRTAQNVDLDEELVLSQDNPPNTDKTEISKTSVDRIVKHELNCNAKLPCCKIHIFRSVFQMSLKLM